ncbi:FHA domain-containing protein [Blastopirellula sp. JC732]|uniref:FHA domain-containing protein n=1 Tax=Blastopirellula sediminis TaxID=2894196 RepID=A0A9X1MJZ9_9BACT|nr:FHA domain-containing protein [Blastopirellula sediminis]MCC9609502.1 FHA domain-containing protein [Blastopirellula sediminis]MCC9627722.1 FHA domain-containing protein [Blastopirellula sediminis]
MSAGNPENPTVTLELLDSSQGTPLQTWTFHDCAEITIGRSDDNDIHLADPQVSRLHAKLTLEDGQWTLHSLGRNGTRLGGKLIVSEVLDEQARFQLGGSGPTLRFSAKSAAKTYSATIDNIDPSAFDFLVIDERKKSEEIQQIVEGEAFQQLQEQAKRLRENQ